MGHLAIESSVMLFLSKLLPIFVYPVGLTLSLLLISGLCLLLNFRRLAVFNVVAAMTLLWVCSTPVFANWVIASLERQYPARTMAETPEADVAIVLGGVLGQPLPPRVEMDLSSAADRILHAARLYRAGKVKRILVPAGNVPWDRALKPEAELIKELLLEWGVASEAIEIATASRNTYENALEIQHISKAKGFKSALLVTSATHMPRAMAVFRRAGIPVIASTTDVLAVDDDQVELLKWLPDASALLMTTNAAKEWMGFLTYKVRGYL
jgi:uncharacterized SAM-binding protein YcdF (DUF218 family)